MSPFLAPGAIPACREVSTIFYELVLAPGAIPPCREVSIIPYMRLYRIIYDNI